MKNIFKGIVMFCFVGLISCEQDKSLDPRPLLVGGQFARLDITHDRILIDDETSYFGGPLTTPSNNVVKYDLYVRVRPGSGSDITLLSDYYLIKSITSFPVELKITKDDIATALQIPVTDLSTGDIFNFYAETFDAEGKKVDFYGLSSTIRSSVSMKQGYRFSTDLTTTALYEQGAFPNYDYNN
jgi:hypothetical protein